MILPIPKPVRERRPRKRLESRKPIRRSNQERKAKAYIRNFSGDVGGHPGHDDFCRSIRCAVLLQRRSDLEAAHVVRRKMGGCHGDWRDIVGLTRRLHRELDRIGLRAFEAKYSVNLRALRHVLVLADPYVPLGEKLAAWERLELEVPEPLTRGRTLQHGWDLCDHQVTPPGSAADLVDLRLGDEP